MLSSFEKWLVFLTLSEMKGRKSPPEMGQIIPKPSGRTGGAPERGELLEDTM